MKYTTLDYYLFHFGIINYNEDFIERITSELFSVHNLWEISPLQNPVKELLSGNTSELEKFLNFFHKHIENEYPFALLITIGNREKNYPQIMLTRNRTIIKI